MSTVTDQANQDALNLISSQVAQSLGLNLLEKSSWSQDDRIAYIQQFKALVLQNPALFNPLTLSIASNISTSNLALSNVFTDSAETNRDAIIASLSAGSNYVEGVLTTAGHLTTAAIGSVDAIADALNGVNSGVSNFGKIAPLIVPVAVVFFLYMATRSASNRIASKRIFS